MKSEIITIGNEVLSGLTLNTNARYLAEEISLAGLLVTRVVTVGDDLREITAAIREAMGRAEVIIVTGGLGPTPDDLTAEAAAAALNTKLKLHEGYLATIREKFARWHLTLTASDERQARIPELGEPLQNPVGVCGFMIDDMNHTFFFLPGVPREVKSIMQKAVMPYLHQKMGQDALVIRTSLLKVFGPTEAQVREMLKELDDEIDIAYLPSFPEVRLRLTVRGRNGDEVHQQLSRHEDLMEQKLGVVLYSKKNEPLEAVVGDLLRERGATIAVAESCTGGLIGHRITEIPGSSDYFMRGLVVYSNDAKEELLGVPHDILEKHGAVSRETAALMAQGVRTRGATTIGLATTGIAGPTGGTPEKPVGRVYIAVVAPEFEEVKEYDLFGDRHQVKLLTSQLALDRVRRYLLRTQD